MGWVPVSPEIVKFSVRWQNLIDARKQLPGNGAVTVPPALQAQVPPGMTSPPQYLGPDQVKITTDQNLIDARKPLPGNLLSGQLLSVHVLLIQP